MATGRMRRFAMVAAAAVVAVVLLVLGHHPPPWAAAPLATQRGPAERTLVLGAGSGFAVDEYVTEPHRQELSVHDSDSRAQIVAYDPGTFDAGELDRRQPIRLGTQDAWLLKAKVPALAWRTMAGVWVAVSGGHDQATVVRLATAVRLEPGQPVVGPVGLTWLPTGLTLTEARIGNGMASETFTAYGRRTFTVRLDAYAVAGNEWTNGTIGLGPPSVVVATRPAWYRLPAGDTGELLLEVGSCGVRLRSSDRDRVPFDALERIIAGATFGTCNGVTEWPPILD
jgi:hypothetical protein